MTQQVLYATSNGAIVQWQDTSVFSYAPAPTGTATLVVTAAQWDTQGTAQYVSGGALVAGTAPVIASVLTLAQQATTLINSGIIITSTGTPALNGTYSTNATAQQNVANIASYISINGKFPGISATTLTYSDISGNPHVFPSTTEFLAFYTAAGDFITDCQTIIMTNAGTLPSNQATIP